MAYVLRVICAVTVVPFLLSTSSTAQSPEGTTAGYRKCHETVRQQGLSDKGAKVHCSTKHERPFDVTLEGEADYSWMPVYSEGYSFAGSVRSSSPDYVVTSYKVTILKPNGEVLDSKEIKNDWVEPGQQSNFVISATELKNSPKIGENDPTKWTWATSDIRGIRIQAD